MQIILFWFGLFPVTFVNCVWIIKCLRANVQSQASAYAIWWSFQISIQSRIVCTRTVNRLTFVFTSTLTHLKHPPSVWPCIGNVNTVLWLLIVKTCLILSFTVISFHPFICISAPQIHWRDGFIQQTLQCYLSLAPLALLDTPVSQLEHLGLKVFSNDVAGVGVQSHTISGLSYFTDCPVNFDMFLFVDNHFLNTEWFDCITLTKM